MEIRVNVINEMIKLRDNVYSDQYTWVDEVIQNCQRSGATHIDVSFEDDRVIISDNGCGCSDPRVLFDKSTSGWDDSIIKSENPFGEGFFSTMTAADTITVKSVGFNAVFDVKKMFETNSIDVVTVTPNKKQSGFTLILSDLRDRISMYSIKERFRNTGKYIKCPTMTVDGERVSYEGLSPNEDSPFLRKINTPLFKGWIVPDTYRDKNHNWSVSTEVKCFAFSRIIKVSTKFPGVRGVINFNENAVTLRSPDRKDFIENEKYDACVEAFREEIRKMYMNVLKRGDDDTLCAYEDLIREYIDIDAYRPHVRFKLLTATGSTEINSGGAGELENNTDDPFSTDIGDSAITDIANAPLPSNDSPTITVQGSNIMNLAAKRQTTRKCISEQTGETISDITCGFYVDESETMDYADDINVAQYYNIPIIVIRNNLERDIIQNDDRFDHITSINDRIELSAEYNNTSPQTEQERRALKLLSRMASAMGVDGDMFTVADTKFQKVLKLNDDTEYTIEDINVIATAYAGHIFINRRFMSAYKDLRDASDTMMPADIKFLLVNGETIAHEMAHVLFNTSDNTKAHAEKTLFLLNSIIKTIYGQSVNVA